MGLWFHEINFPDESKLPTPKEFYQELCKHTGLKIDLKEYSYLNKKTGKSYLFYRFYHRTLKDWEKISFSITHNSMEVSSGATCNSYLYMSILYLITKYGLLANATSGGFALESCSIEEIINLIPKWATIPFSQAQKHKDFVPYGFNKTWAGQPWEG